MIVAAVVILVLALVFLLVLGLCRMAAKADEQLSALLDKDGEEIIA